MCAHTELGGWLPQGVINAATGDTGATGSAGETGAAGGGVRRR
eukprot:gene50847-15681_t